jgi:hypothetical protein
VRVIWNPPRRPQDNGVVERSQGTGKRWAETPSCRDAAELQRRIDELDAIQRESYPSVAGRSRAEAFPGLGHAGRPYDPAEEASRWDRDAVLRHLAGYTAIRRADVSGTVSLYNRNRYVGAGLKGRLIYITLDPHEAAWVFQGHDGTCYRRQPAEELSAERIIGLQVTHRRDRPRRPSRQTPMAEFPAPPHVA